MISYLHSAQPRSRGLCGDFQLSSLLASLGIIIIVELGVTNLLPAEGGVALTGALKSSSTIVAQRCTE